ncbi:MAG: S49 family peptidase, partial [Bacteroidota bacterium]
MSNFFKILFGSCLGTIVGLGVLFFLGISIFAGIAGSAEQKPTVSANSIMTLDLSVVPELTGNTPLDPGFGFNLELDMDEVLGLHYIVCTIEKAKEDDDIKGIYLNSMYQAGGFTKLRIIREALTDFRSSGKFVLSYAPAYDQSAYYLASAGDEVYMGPLGAVDFRGFGADIPFYKEMMDKVGVRFEVFYAGDFKSATEPYRRTNMSDENRLQTRQYLTALWEYQIADVAESRELSEAKVRSFANEVTGWKDQVAVDAGLVDGIKRRSEVDERLHELVGFEEDKKLNKISIEKYFSAKMKKLRGGN